MPENVSALQLVLTGDPALFAIVRLSLIVSLSAVAAGGPDRPAARRLARAVALSRPRRRDRRPQCADGPAAGRGRALRVSAAVAIGAARIVGHPVHAAGDDHRADDPDRADHRRAGAADHRGSLARISRRARGDECRHARPRRDAALGRPLQPAHRAARRLRPRRRRGRRRDHRRRQYRRLHPHHDHGDRARDLQGRSAARDRARHGPDRHRGRRSTRAAWGTRRFGERMAG